MNALTAAPPRPDTIAPLHAVVVGSGFGGLAAAVRLGARGYRVTVLERLEQPGGRAAVFRQDGFTFDAGPTIVTAPFLLEELWNLCGRRLADDVELRAIDPFYRIRFDDGAVFDYRGDAGAMRDEVARFAACRRGRLRALHARQRGDLPRRLRAARRRAVPALDRHGAGRARPRAAGRLAQRVWHGVALRPRRAAAHRAQLPSAAGRRQSVRRERHLRADRLPRAALGRALSRWAAPGGWCRAWSG